MRDCEAATCSGCVVTHGLRWQFHWPWRARASSSARAKMARLLCGTPLSFVSNRPERAARTDRLGIRRSAIRQAARVLRDLRVTVVRGCRGRAVGSLRRPLVDLLHERGDARVERGRDVRLQLLLAFRTRSPSAVARRTRTYLRDGGTSCRCHRWWTRGSAL